MTNSSNESDVGCATPWPWIGAALLSAAWLPATGYFHAPHAGWHLALVGLAIVLLRGVPVPQVTSREAWFIVLTCAVCIWLAPWPYRTGAILLLTGGVLALRRSAAGSRSDGRLSCAMLAGGTIWSAQSLVMLAYEVITSRSHELPQWLTHLLAAVMQLMGMDVAATTNVDGAALAVRTMRQSHLMAASLELLFDPATCCLVVAGLVLLLLRGAAIDRNITATTLRGVWVFLLIVAAWLPLRVGLLLAVYVHRALRTEFDAPLALMSQFWHSGVLALLLLPPACVAARWCPMERLAHSCTPCSSTRQRLPIAALFALCVGMATLLSAWHPVGQRQSGRVLIDEYHSSWEPTDKPYDTETYGRLAGYNYACLYDFLSRHYEINRLTTRIALDSLANCDVLILKIPTRRYDPDEIGVIHQFVERGGGLVMIGEHTNIFGCGTYLNEIALPFGFRFLYDCLFGIDTWFDQAWRRPMPAHPIVHPLRTWDFAVSCTIEPRGTGVAVVRSVGLKNLPSDYHASNFYPQLEDRPDMRYGAFVQLWATRHGKGRVVAFGDSTQFSNFCLFDAGKSEVAMRMVEWANHRGGATWHRPVGTACGVLAVLVFVLCCIRRINIPLLAVAGMLGWAIGAHSVEALHARAMPNPAPIRPLTRVIMDRTLCDAPLPKTGFVAGLRDGFGIFEMWMLRLGLFTARGAHADALSGNVLVMTHPHLSCPPSFQASLTRWVEAGGRLLILDSPENAQSTANSVLWPFGIRFDRQSNHSGPLTSSVDWPAAPIENAYEIKRIIHDNKPVVQAEPVVLAAINDKPVAMRVPFGKGAVTAIGFGSRFCDAAMGVTPDVVPGDDLKQVFALQFAILRGMTTD